LFSRVPIDVRPCVHMWVPTAHCPPDHIAERAVESCCQRLQQCERTRSRPHRPAVRTRNRTAGVVHSAMCE
jgi:hypothetical protein